MSRWSLLLALLGAIAAGASGFHVAPTRMELSARTPAAALTLRNLGAEDVLIQAEVRLWRQEAGADDYASTSDLVISPPIFTLEPAGKQIVRVGLRGTPEGGNERAYRLFLTRVPEAETTRGSEGVRFALQLAIPVFVRPPEPVAPCLEWRLAERPRPSLTLINHGNAHVQVLEVAVSVPASDSRVATASRAFYVLPGGRITVDLVAGASVVEWIRADDLLLLARTDRGPESVLLLPSHTSGLKAAFRPDC